mgnify:CR=1 FL=1
MSDAEVIVDFLKSKPAEGEEVGIELTGQFFVHVGDEKIPLTPELLKAICKPGHPFGETPITSRMITAEFAKVLTKDLGEMSPAEKFRHFAGK